MRQGNAAGHRDEGDRVEASVEGGAGVALAVVGLITDYKSTAPRAHDEHHGGHLST